MNEVEIREKIQSAVDDAKNAGWEMIPSNDGTWFKWREGKNAPKCTVLGAVLRKANLTEGGNFVIPNPRFWFESVIQVLGVTDKWISLFLKSQTDLEFQNIILHLIHEDDKIAVQLGKEFYIESEVQVQAKNVFWENKKIPDGNIIYSLWYKE